MSMHSKKGIAVEAELSVEHKGETITVQNQAQHLVINFPSWKTLVDASASTSPSQNLLKQVNEIMMVYDLTCSVKIKQRKLLTLGDSKSPDINYMKAIYLAILLVLRRLT